MAIKLSANYSKKLGLPQYSSHSFSASVEIELTDITQVEAEIQKIEDINEIVKFGVMSTPALAVDGEVKIVGKVASPQEIMAVLPH